MQYILFETQANFAEFILFSICGFAGGLVFKLAKCENSIAKSSALFFFMAVCVVIMMANIDKSHIGYQTIAVPLAFFLLSSHLFKSQ